MTNARGHYRKISIHSRKDSRPEYAEVRNKPYGNYCYQIHSYDSPPCRMKPKEETKAVKRKKKEPRKLEYFMA